MELSQKPFDLMLCCRINVKSVELHRLLFFKHLTLGLLKKEETIN